MSASPQAGYAGLDEASLYSALDRLLSADLLFVEGAAPDVTYRFKHALIQDAAYEGLLKSRRQALHRRAAEALIEAAGESEAVAHHFTEAGLDDQAIEWWGKAGDKALGRSAFKEAIAQLGKAIAMADKAEEELEAGRETRRSSRLLKLHTDYGHAVMWSKGFAAEETSAAYARAGELARPATTRCTLCRLHAQCRGFMRADLAWLAKQLKHSCGKRKPRGARRKPGWRTALSGLSCHGDLPAARPLERALGDTRERDGETLFCSATTLGSARRPSSR